MRGSNFAKHPIWVQEVTLNSYISKCWKRRWLLLPLKSSNIIGVFQLSSWLNSTASPYGVKLHVIIMTTMVALMMTTTATIIIIMIIKRITISITTNQQCMENTLVVALTSALFFNNSSHVFKSPLSALQMIGVTPLCLEKKWLTEK